LRKRISENFRNYAMVDLSIQGKHDDQPAVAPVYAERVMGAGFDPGRIQVVASCAEARSSVVVKSNIIYIPSTGSNWQWSAASTAVDSGNETTTAIQIEGVTTGRWLPVSSLSLNSTPVTALSIDPAFISITSGAATLSIPKWRRMVDVDFSTLSNQSISANGAVTLGGTTFQIENIGSLYAAYTAVFGIVNGAGFRVPSHASGSVLAGKTARTLPMISWQLPANVKANVGVRAVAQFANSSPTSAASIMLEYGSASPMVVNKYNLVVFGASGIIAASGCQIGRTQITDAFTSYTTDGTADISGFTTGIEGATLLNGFTALFDVSSTANLSDIDTIPRTLRDNSGMVGAVPLATVGRLSNWRVAVSFGQTSVAVGSYATMKRLIIELFY
jgi:hypothetical protein